MLSRTLVHFLVYVICNYNDTIFLSGNCNTTVTYKIQKEI